VGVVKDLFLLILQCVVMLKNQEFATFLGTLIGGFLLGAICWLLCSRYSRLWNLRYRVTLTHHVLCGIAAVLTLLFILTFVSLKYTRQVAEAIIASWQQQIQADSAWENKTFRKAFEQIKALGVEDFSNYPHPDQGGHTAPASKQESRQTLATVYATEAVKHFNKSHPYLSMILRAEPGISPKIISDDVTAFFAAHPGELYLNMNAVRLAADHIRRGLDVQVPRVVPISRTVIVILFLLVQAIPFGLIGVAAYRDLKVTI
jgi:hypothetical protein